MKWVEFENEVRWHASLIWGREAKKLHKAGIDLDCVLEIENDNYIVIEITKNKKLDKIRGDINRLVTIKNAYKNDDMYCKCFIITSFDPTKSMIEAAKENKIIIESIENFKKRFFNYEEYKLLRKKKGFGSAVDPITGKSDEAKYIPVSYIECSQQRELFIQDIAHSLINKKKIVLLGDFGTGKSRCFKELFEYIVKEHRKYYPIAIDLRNTWGLISAEEIIRRHFESLGMGQDYINNIIKSYSSDKFCFLLDGFDEVGTKPWGDKPGKLEEIRKFALQGIKDLIINTEAGIIISGRDYYFNSNNEMLSTLGLKSKDTMIIECKSEFNEKEFEEFRKINNINIEMPSWLPKKPLVLKTIASFDKKEIEEIFKNSIDIDNDAEFLEKFLNIMCERDANIHPILDGDSIKKILLHLAQKTRTKSQDVGPISQKDVIDAFTNITSSTLTEHVLVMLQRLPGLGRVDSESDERSFIDIFILDGLRGENVYEIVINDVKTAHLESWIQPLRELGQKVLLNKISKENESETIGYFSNACMRMIDKQILNKTLIADIVTTLFRSNNYKFDFENRILDNAFLSSVYINKPSIKNLTIEDCVIERICIGVMEPENLIFKRNIIHELIGVYSKDTIPDWLIDSEIEKYDQKFKLAHMKEDLSASQKILVSILIKVYRQRGDGRKEITLNRGLRRVDKTIKDDILKYLTKEGILNISKNRAGEKIYKPVKKHTKRVEKILNEQKRSKDKIWVYVSSLSE